ELLVAGSIALDNLEGSFGTVHDELGGSALYFALAASLIMPVRMMAPVGAETAGRLEAAIQGRPIDATLVAVLDEPTYRWRAVQGPRGAGGQSRAARRHRVQAERVGARAGAHRSACDRHHRGGRCDRRGHARALALDRRRSKRAARVAVMGGGLRVAHHRRH